MIRERTRAGLDEARAQGRLPGRKPKITAEQKKEIVEAVSSGRKTPAEIARRLKIIAEPCRGSFLGPVPGDEPPQIRRFCDDPRSYVNGGQDPRLFGGG